MGNTQEVDYSYYKNYIDDDNYKIYIDNAWYCQMMIDNAILNLKNEDDVDFIKRSICDIIKIRSILNKYDITEVNFESKNNELRNEINSKIK